MQPRPLAAEPNLDLLASVCDQKVCRIAFLARGFGLLLREACLLVGARAHRPSRPTTQTPARFFRPPPPLQCTTQATRSGRIVKRPLWCQDDDDAPAAAAPGECVRVAARGESRAMSTRLFLESINA